MNPILLSLGLLLALTQGLQLPAPRGHVNDFAGVLPAASVQRMEQIARDVRARSGGEIAVVTLADLGGRDVSEVALQIGRDWGVGAQGGAGNRARNAGAVVLIVPRESAPDGRGRCWISTGRGAEGFILDSDAGAICREATPFFQQRDYGSGTELVTYRVAQEFEREFSFTLDTALRAVAPVGAPPRGPQSSRGPPIGMFIFVIVIILLMSRGGRGGRRRRRRGGFYPIFIPGPRRGGWGGGGFGGGGFGGGGFGGGGFGGGGFGGFGGGGGFSGGGGGSSW